MLHQVRALGEGLATVGTGIWPLACVPALVARQLRPVVKAFATLSVDVGRRQLRPGRGPGGGAHWGGDSLIGGQLGTSSSSMIRMSTAKQEGRRQVKGGRATGNIHVQAANGFQLGGPGQLMLSGVLQPRECWVVPMHISYTLSHVHQPLEAFQVFLCS